MYQNERKKIILDHLRLHGTSSPAQIRQITGSSIATVRRDLAEMEGEGLLKRHHGYVQLLDQTDLPVQMERIEEKERIARAAAAQIHDGDTIFLGSGTTCTCLARYLSGKRNLTVATINIDAIPILIQLKDVKLSILGGDVNVENGYVETMDEYTIQVLKRLYFEKVFVTVNGIDFEYGYSIRKHPQLFLFQYLLENSKAFYCIADSSKFEKRTYLQFCSIEEIRYIVTTREVRQRYAAQFAQRNIQVFSDE